MPYDPKQHRRRSIRVRNFDYSGPGPYFVTICAVNRQPMFGEIADHGMHLSRNGAIVWDVWTLLPDKFPGILCDAFVVMPNHVHGVIVGAGLPRPYEGVGQGITSSPDRPKPHLGSVVAFLKYESAKRINRIRGTPAAPVWQRNYFEHVVRDPCDLSRVREYITTNPLRWILDRENPAREGTDEFDEWLESIHDRPVGAG